MVKNKYSTIVTLDENNSLTYIIDHIGAGSTVLEFGPATGYMTKYLKEEKNCSVYIIEIDENAYNEAMKFAVDGFCGDAEKEEWFEKFKGLTFDYITFADVLEHLRNPLMVLKRASELLNKESGLVLISIPNIAHNAVLVDLYNNKFEYRSTGIMDNTHLRFFTHDSVVSMFRDAGLYPVDEDQVVFDLEYAGLSNKSTDVPDSVWAALRLRKYGYVNQFLFALSCNEAECIFHEKPTEEEECSVYYTDGVDYDEDHKAVGLVQIASDKFKIDLDIIGGGDGDGSHYGVPISKLMLHVLPFSCCIGDLKISIPEDQIESIVPDNGYKSSTGSDRYTFIGSPARLEVLLKDTLKLTNLTVSGHLYPIEYSILCRCLKDRDKALEYAGQEEGRLNQVVEEKLSIIHEMSDEICRLNAVVEEKMQVIADLTKNLQRGVKSEDGSDNED